MIMHNYRKALAVAAVIAACAACTTTSTKPSAASTPDSQPTTRAQVVAQLKKALPNVKGIEQEVAAISSEPPSARCYDLWGGPFEPVPEFVGDFDVPVSYTGTELEGYRAQFQKAADLLTTARDACGTAAAYPGAMQYYRQAVAAIPAGLDSFQVVVQALT